MDLKSLQIHHNIHSPPPSPAPTAHIHHKPYFYWGKEAQFLFPGWPDNHSGMYALSLVMVFTMAILIEFVSNLRLVRPGSNRMATVFFRAGMQGIRAGFGYIVILAVVSYNAGVFIVAVLGHAVGFVIFGGRVGKKGSG